MCQKWQIKLSIYVVVCVCVAVCHHVLLCVTICRCVCVCQLQLLFLPVSDLKPVGPDWTSEATESFKSLVATGQSPIRLYMIVVERNSGSLSVKLVDTSGDDVNGKDLGTQLIAMGMAASKSKQGQFHKFDK